MPTRTVLRECRREIGKLEVWTQIVALPTYPMAQGTSMKTTCTAYIRARKKTGKAEKLVPPKRILWHMPSSGMMDPDVLLDLYLRDLNRTLGILERRDGIKNPEQAAHKFIHLDDNERPETEALFAIPALPQKKRREKNEFEEAVLRNFGIIKLMEDRKK